MCDPVKKADNNRRYYEDVIASLKGMMMRGELKCGEKLPSERELAEKFNVSRVPIREALKILEYMGILETTPADGTYVKNIASEDLLGKMRFSVSATAVTMMDLLELRISLETFAAYYAAIRRTDEDIEAIRSAIVDMREAKKAPIMDEEAMQNLRYMSYQFHRKIVGAAHNAVLTSVYESLYELLDISQQFTISTSGISYNSILAHETLFDKIVHRDAEGAKRGMSEHLEDVRITLRNSTGEDDEQTL